MDELREKHTDRTAQSALSLLKSTDWYVIRKTETEEAIPDDVATYRAAVRAAEKKITKAIAAKKTVTGLKNMFVAPDDGNAPMHDWPDPLE
jgi:diketogulonate reductase-like aldo/keto reductase